MPNAKALVDFDFDENKVINIGALSVSSYLGTSFCGLCVSTERANIT